MRRRNILTIFIVLLCSFVSMSQNKLLDYEIAGNGTGVQGRYLVNVCAISPSSKLDDAQIAKCAVHGVLFKGFSNKELRQNQKPIIEDASIEAANQDFFKSFFADGGAYGKYVEIVNQSRKVIKSGKQYKVFSDVTVNKEQLRKDLESAGIIKSINSIF